VGGRARAAVRTRLLPVAERRPDLRPDLVADRLEQNALATAAVELRVEDLLPWA
jgi:hypothetical protein